MTRKKQIERAAKKYRQFQGKVATFSAGAEWADQNLSKEVLEKVYNLAKAENYKCWKENEKLKNILFVVKQALESLRDSNFGEEELIANNKCIEVLEEIERVLK